MNSPYHPPPDMSQRQQIPMAPAAAPPGYPTSMPPMHGYQHQQHQHQHQQPPLPLPPPPPHSQAHPHQHQLQHQHQHHQHQHQPHQQQQHQSHQQHQHPSRQHQLQPPPPQHPLSHHQQQPPLPPPSQQLPPPTSHHHLQHHPLHQQPPLPSQHQQPPPPQHQHQASRSETSSATSPTTGEPIVRVLVPFSKVDESTSRKYSLDVVQQPLRARMCGFGDKDRRPITPPPCVRLTIIDAITGKEVDCNSDIDYSMFVLNVDLWNEDGTREVNLVRSSSGTPSVTSSSSYSYTLNGGDSTPGPYSQQVLPPSREPAYSQSPAMGYVSNYSVQQSYGQAPPSYPPNGSYGPPTQYFPQHGGYREPTVLSLPSQGGMAPFRNGPQPGYAQDQSALTRMALGGQPQGMFTRNLIGSLAASAFRLSDTNDKIGVWFVLQDLSVRTEGPFRLRFSFVNVGPPGGQGRDANGNKVNQGRAPILASCFSDVFHVYSAKKFPGVCESTGLSKTFATQGIKIPIRKDAKGEDDGYMDGG